MAGHVKRGFRGLAIRLSRWPYDCLAGALVAALCIGAYLLIDHAGRPDKDAEREGARLSAIMAEHDARMTAAIDKITEGLSHGADTLRLLDSVAATLSDNDEYCYYIFSGDDLRYWHGAMLPDASLTPRQIRTPMTSADNGRYYARRREMGGCTLCVLMRVYSTHPYSNDFLANEFSPSLGLPSYSQMSASPRKGAVDVASPGGAYLFSVINPWASELPRGCLALSIVALVAFALAALWTAGRFARGLQRNGADAFVAAASAIPLYGVVYVVMLLCAPPWGGGGLLMFSAPDFSFDDWLPSYWALATLALCDLHCGYTFFRMADPQSFKLSARGKMGGYALAALLTVSCAASFLIANGVLDVLVRHSRGLSFYAGEIDMSVASVVKICLLGAAFVAFLFTADRAVVTLSRVTGPVSHIAALCGGAALTAVAGERLFGGASGVVIGAGFAALCTAMYFMKRRGAATVRFSHFVWMVLLTSGFALILMTRLNEAKEGSYRQLLASNLSFQLMRDDDPIAEQLLPQVATAIRSDSVLTSLMDAMELSHDRIYSHVRNRYFNGYFSRYDLQVIPCRGSASTIQMTTSGDVEDCVSYFDNLTATFGHRVPEAPNFYSLHDEESRPSYIAKLDYDSHAPRASATPNRLYIEITLKNAPRAAGYPELLTNKRDMMGESKIKGYSYAMYDLSRLTVHHGDFDYPATASLTSDSTAQLPETPDVSHFSLKGPGRHTIVVTYPRQSMSNILTCFSYLFLGLLVVSTLIMAAASRSRLTFFGHMDIGERIHASLVFFIISFFGIMSAISGYQAVTGYEVMSKRHLSQVMSSFYIALSDELGDRTADDVSPDAMTTADMDYILQRTSSATGADAHLFDVRGRLIGSSRRELFLSGIAAPLMNSKVLLAMRDGEQSEAYVKEYVGSMLQYAAYTPVHNGAGDVVGYINVPQFNDVGKMRSQVIASIEPMTNSLVLIVILAIIASSALARGITRPLIVLRDRLKRADLQTSEARLAYPYDDEVGQVVAAYNKMNDKLRAQAERLAATERESTWREMARQIAHEIKNPLTPMKLSIQYLLKCWDTRRENFEPMLRKTAQTLVDQIDQLSAVASQFSGIAKMKQAEPVVFDLAARVSATAMLFGRSDEAAVTYAGPQEGVLVKADPDLMTSVFNNLVKNAQQSAADGRKVDIGVVLEVKGDRVSVSVSDNGDGISDEIREKIFRPNFTTKSTGMGLGLAITKNIVDNSGGEIAFETQVGVGTTFTVTLPLSTERASN